MRTLEALAVLCIAGCGGGALEPAELVLNEEACSLCRMAVSVKPFAAQAVARSGRTDFFDDIGCLVRWAAEHAPAEETALFVVDHETGAWLDAKDAHYVRSETLDTPMSSGLAAFGTQARAMAAAKPLKGRVLGWEALCKEEAS
ncbi:MAG: nitrous oxide reductase accessory protein NosL [Planctomycetota bacterium]|jgi:copper chaperone NosL